MAALVAELPLKIVLIAVKLAFLLRLTLKFSNVTFLNVIKPFEVNPTALSYLIIVF